MGVSHIRGCLFDREGTSCMMAVLRSEGVEVEGGVEMEEGDPLCLQ